MRDALVRMHDHREELARLSRGAFARADIYSWERQGQRMAAVYREVLEANRHNTARDRIQTPPIGRSSPAAEQFVAETISGFAAASDPTIARRN